MNCPFCHEPINKDKRFCPACGKYIPAEYRENSELSADTDDTAVHDFSDTETSETAADFILNDPSDLDNSDADSSETKSDSPEEAPVISDTFSDDCYEDSAAPTEAPNDSFEDSSDTSQENAEQAGASFPFESDDPLDLPNTPGGLMYPQPIIDIRPEKKSHWAPVTTCGWIGILLLMLVPVVNLIFVLVWSFGGARRNVKQSFARAVLVLWLIFGILIIAALLFMRAHGYTLSNCFRFLSSLG